MNKLMMQVGGVVAAVTIFALLAGVGYLTQIGLTQTFGPADTPRQNKSSDPMNRARSNDGKYEPIPMEEKVWIDYPEDDLDNEERLPDRPGNFEVVSQVARLLQGLYAVEPDYPDLAFPFWKNSKKCDSEAEWNKNWAEQDARDRADGNYRRNELRQYNLELSTLKFVNIPSNSAEIANFSEYGMSQSNYSRFQKMREHHKERCVLVLAYVELESLRSENIESNAKDPWKFFFVRKSDGWKLAYYAD